MNNRRLSYGLLISIAALAAACGGENPPAEAPANASATATAEAPPASGTAEAPPPPVTATAEAPPPPPPPKPAKDKWAGKFAQDFSGAVADAAEATAVKAAGAKKDAKKHDAAIEKAKKAADWTIENTADGSVWSTKGKAAHTMAFKITKGDDPNTLTISFVKDGKKELKSPIEVSINFKDDDTFEVKDPFAKKDPVLLVFKRQK